MDDTGTPCRKAESDTLESSFWLLKVNTSFYSNVTYIILCIILLWNRCAFMMLIRIL
jgi:hypothetical protein